MEYIGITAEQVEKILEAGGTWPGVNAIPKVGREAIAKLIEENNKKLLEDVTTLIMQRTTSGHL